MEEIRRPKCSSHSTTKSCPPQKSGKFPCGSATKSKDGKYPGQRKSQKEQKPLSS